MEDMEREDVSTEKKELPKLQKLKEEYGAVANDLSFVFLWMQRELLASQTLTDLAKCGKPREKQNVQSSTEEDEEEDSYVSNDEESTWTKYIPPSQTTITTLENTNKTEKTVLSNPSGAKVLGEEMLDIARALEDLNCGNPKKRGTENETPNNPSLSNLSSVDSTVGPKPKKRRRRRHEIVRNFKCNINGCTKSYGSEGALKTHVRLKHTGGGSDISQERKREDTGMNPYYSMNYPGAAGMPIILPPPSVPHAGDDPMIPQFKSFTPETRTDERLPPFSQVAHFGHAPEPMQSDHFNFVIRPNVMRT